MPCSVFQHEHIIQLQNSAIALPGIAQDPVFTQILYSLPPILLPDVGRVSLMNRTDTKFFFDANLLPHLLQNTDSAYFALDMNGLRCIPYQSLYYDTPNFDLYLHHHNGKQNRYKLRYRRYTNTDTSFFEVKQKNNKGRTIKTRTQSDNIKSQLDQPAVQLLEQQTGSVPALFEPVLWINYFRTTLVAQNFSERVTIDLGLHFHAPHKSIYWEHVCIVEVKQDAAFKHSRISEALKQFHILPQSLSKYCVGMAATYQNIKQNQFKAKLLQIEKIELAHAANHSYSANTNI